MGWNQGYKIYEQTVISVYDLGVLTKETLNALMQPYYGTDIDHGGCEDLRAHDGLCADEIVCKVMEPEKFATIISAENGMPDCVQWTGDGRYYIPGDYGNYKYETWQETVKNAREVEVYDLWREIAQKEWELC